MSFAVANNVQYRLTPKDGGTLITLHHTALGLFPDGYRRRAVEGLPDDPQPREAAARSAGRPTRRMRRVDAMLQELDQEAATRRVLERVPDDRLGSRPHPKARTLGELALHVAVVPGVVASFAWHPCRPVQFPTSTAIPRRHPRPPWCRPLAERQRQAPGRRARRRGTGRKWRLVNGDRELFAAPRRVPTSGDAEPLVPPPRPVDRLSA